MPAIATRDEAATVAGDLRQSLLTRRLAATAVELYEQLATQQASLGSLAGRVVDAIRLLGGDDQDPECLVPLVERLQRGARILGQTITADAETVLELTGIERDEDGDADYAAAWERLHDIKAERYTQAAQIAKVLARHVPWYEVQGVRHDHTLHVAWDDAPKGHVCRIGAQPEWDNCSREDEQHVVLACVECRGATDEGETGYLFWPCSTVRDLGGPRAHTWATVRPVETVDLVEALTEQQRRLRLRDEGPDPQADEQPEGGAA